MMKKLKNTNFLFAIFLISGLLLHIFFVLIVPFAHDETFYATIPFRLVNGDSLIQDEWHLTQFSSLFSCLPVYIWTAIKGSADGIFIFLRCIYLLIHTTVAVIIYAFFRKYGKWAVMASMMFYVQIPYRILAISYHSMFVVFLLLLSMCLVSIYEKHSTGFYLFAGICFGCCCVCNPLFCSVFALYLVACVLWKKRQTLQKLLTINSKKERKLTKKQKKQELAASSVKIEKYHCFFTKEAIIKIFCGVLIVAFIAVVFYFATGATISTLTQNLKYLLGSSEYDIASYSIFTKFKDTFSCFSRANLGMPWILPVLFIILLTDRNRKKNSHRFGYLLALVIWSIVFVFALLTNMEFYLWALSLPFFAFSTACYLLTENKNKVLFHCMYLPCLIGTFFHYLAADMHLATIGIVLAIANVPGVFFAMDLWKEMKLISESNYESGSSNKNYNWHRGVIIVGFCFQLLFYSTFYMLGQIPVIDAEKATSGPYSGLYMTQRKCESYNKTISDLDYIKSISDEDAPVLLATYNSWMYLHLDRPMATYTTWYRGSLDLKQLIAYYEENPEKTPEYIYIESSDPDSATVQSTMDIANKMFRFTKEELSNGVLLTVEDCKF